MTKKKPDFWHSRNGYITEFVSAIVIAYGTASLAINSGSLIQYFVTFVLLGIAINRLMKIFRK